MSAPQGFDRSWLAEFVIVAHDAEGAEGPDGSLGSLLCKHCNDVGPRIDDGVSLLDLVEQASQHWHECPALMA
jgi:hypothetical protein